MYQRYPPNPIKMSGIINEIIKKEMRIIFPTFFMILLPLVVAVFSSLHFFQMCGQET